LTIQEFAAATGIGIWTLRYHLKTGRLKPLVEGGHSRGQRHMFSREQAIEFKEREVRAFAIESLRTYDADIAQKCFTAFKEGRPLTSLVIDYGFHPETVRAAHSEWVRFNASYGMGLVVPINILREINRLDLDGPHPIETPEELLIAITETLKAQEDARLCSDCRKGLRALCTQCVSRRIKRAKAEVASTAEPEQTQGQGQGPERSSGTGT
jgi:hypothetical protein